MSSAASVITGGRLELRVASRSGGRLLTDEFIPQLFPRASSAPLTLG